MGVPETRPLASVFDLPSAASQCLHKNALLTLLLYLCEKQSAWEGWEPV